MDRQDLHRSFLRYLLTLRDDCVQQVRLVTRLCHDALLGGDHAERTFVFLPDLHLLSRGAEAQYHYSFHAIEPGRFVQRDGLLDRLCGVLLEFAQQLPPEHTVKTIQLGDFLDLWRENEFAADDVTALVARILNDNPEARRRLVRVDAASLEPDVLLGNHDLKMLHSIELSHARRTFTYAVGDRRSLLVTHGDLFDALEGLLDDNLQDWFLERFGRGVSAHRYALDRTIPDAISLSDCYLQRVQQPSACMLSKMYVVAQLGVLPPPLEAAPDADQRLSNKRGREEQAHGRWLCLSLPVASL